MSTFAPQSRIAVLVDGDNARPDRLAEVLRLVGKHGRITLKRIYGDWTMPQMNCWKAAVQKHGVQPVQQFRNSVGKNATDGAMIIDAMDILHANVVEGFAIVSNDGDFTRLVTRLRENGLSVIGLGEKAQAAVAFVMACDLFVDLTGSAKEPVKPAKAPEPKKTAAAKPPVSPLPPLPELHRAELRGLFGQAFEACRRDDGWATIVSFGVALRKVCTGFNPKSYGSAQLGKLLARCPELVELRRIENGASAQIEVRFMGGA